MIGARTFQSHAILVLVAILARPSVWRSPPKNVWRLVVSIEEIIPDAKMNVRLCLVLAVILHLQTNAYKFRSATAILGAVYTKATTHIVARFFGVRALTYTKFMNPISKMIEW
jgi:hypothetical protein